MIAITVIANAPPDGILDQQIRVVDMGKYNVAVGVLHRSAKPAQQAALEGIDAHFVKGDVEALCALPFDINEVHRIAARDPDFSGVRLRSAAPFGLLLAVST